MTSDGVLAPGEQVVFRSGPVMRTSISLSLLVTIGSLALWFALDSSVRAMFTAPQIITLAFFVLFMDALMLSIGLSKLVATAAGITVRNCLVTRRYAWSQVEGANLGSGDAWANLQLAASQLHPDGETHMVLAIQRAEGERGEQRIAELQQLIRANNPSAVDPELRELLDPEQSQQQGPDQEQGPTQP